MGREMTALRQVRPLIRTEDPWLERRQAIEPAIGHLQQDHRVDRYWLQASLGDAAHSVLRAIG